MFYNFFEAVRFIKALTNTKHAWVLYNSRTNSTKRTLSFASNDAKEKEIELYIFLFLKKKQQHVQIQRDQYLLLSLSFDLYFFFVILQTSCQKAFALNMMFICFSLSALSYFSFSYAYAWKAFYSTVNSLCKIIITFLVKSALFRLIIYIRCM